MLKQLLIEKGVACTRIALLYDKELRYFYIDHIHNTSKQNVVVQGQITQIVKSIQSAFVDYGEEKNGLLPLKHIPPILKNSIQQGLRLPVQIVKEQTGEKGNKLTGLITLPGKYVVCLPFEDSINISKNINDKNIREELKQWILDNRPAPFGFILRTDAKDVDKAILLEEIHALCSQATQLLQEGKTMSKGTLLLTETPLWLQIFFDYMHATDEIEIISNDTEILSIAKQKLAPYTNFSILYQAYASNTNLFSLFQVEKAFHSCLKKRVWLKNGANIIIEKTEAMTVIDVNSAKMLDKKSGPKGLISLNKLAVEEVLRQVMLRNLSGIIIVDLVDLKTEEEKREVNHFISQYIQQLEGNRTKSYPLTPLGLLQLVRTKKYPGFMQQLAPYESEKDKDTPAVLSYLLLQLEEEVKRISRTTSYEAITIQVLPWFYTYLCKEDIAIGLSQLYGTTIVLEENSDLKNKFYSFVYSH